MESIDNNMWFKKHKTLTDQKTRKDRTLKKDMTRLLNTKHLLM